MVRSTRGLRAWLAIFPIAALGLGSGCGVHEPPPSAAMSAAVDPFLDSLAAYDRWARRLGMAESAFRSQEALREAAFAPLRQQSGITGAWLVREGPDASELRYPDGAPPCPDDGWTRLVSEDLGELRAQERSLVWAGETRATTLIQRSRPAPGGATLHVTVAYTSEDGR